MTKEKLLSLAALVVAVIALGIGVFGGGKTTEVIREVVKEMVGVAPGGTFDSYAHFRDGVRRTYPILSTTTSATVTSYTMAGSDFNNPQSLRVVTLGSDANYTWTTPASSSLTQLVPQPFDREEICYYVQNATGVKRTLFFAAGTGVDFVMSTTTLTTVATSSGSTIGIPQGKLGCLDLFREPGVGLGQVGDIQATVKFNVAADESAN